MKDFDQINAPIGMKDDRTRTTMMNLRIREDTAKYLFNLDVESAFYDPKTRSMRDNPLKHLKDSEQGIYRGDNVMRHTGNADTVTKMEVSSNTSDCSISFLKEIMYVLLLTDLCMGGL